VSFVWQTFLTTLPAMKAHFLIVLSFTVVEVLIPAERRQSVIERLSHAAYNVSYFVLSPFAMILPGALVVAFTRRFGPGLIHLNLDGLTAGIGTLSWPVRNLLLPLVPLFVSDFFYYWHHRLQHRVPALWTSHRLHHSAEGLNALASYRVHWLEEPLRVFTMVIPMGILFDINAVQGAWIAFALAQMGLLIHTNVRIPYGPLTPVLLGPQLHRLHHSPAPEHRDKNYAANFPVWDILFGTYVAPKRGEWPSTGLPDGERAHSIPYELAYPFVALWRRVRTVFSGIQSGKQSATE
jgi:sterol desaturase/sphingolipid hydroxylase (fatty acid hydroxylase superfamily)